MAFTNVEVFPYAVTFNKYDRPLFRQCAAMNFAPAPPPMLGVRSTRCGADAMVIVKRTSAESGKTYSDAMCDAHAAPWKAAV